MNKVIDYIKEPANILWISIATILGLFISFMIFIQIR